MFGLIIKQLRLQRIHIILLSLGIVAVAVLSFFFSYFSISSEELDPNSTILALFLLLYISADAVSTVFFTADESKKWASFIISTPLGARGQVKSQYLLTIFMLFAVNTACFVISSICDIISGESGSGIFGFSAIAFYLLLLFKSVELPFTVYFGSKMGNNVKTGILLGLFFIIGVYLLFGDLSIFGSWDSFMKWLTGIFTGDTKATESMIITMTLSQLAALALYYVSYRISCKLYAKGAMNYEH